MKNLSESEVYKIANPIWESMSSASNSGDYEKFISHFSTELKELITKERFESQAKEFPLLTSLKNNAMPVACIRRSEGTTVIYKQLSSALEGEFIGQLTLKKTKNGCEVVNAQVY